MITRDAEPWKNAAWHDWKWQLANAIRTIEHLRKWIDVTRGEERAIRASVGVYRWRITPYYASLMSPTDESCPVRRQAVPSKDEFARDASADIDPVGDRKYRRTHRIIHKYRDRVAMLVSDVCPVYCRHCTRKYHTTDLHGTYFGSDQDRSLEPEFEYLRSHSEIRDVLLTGGDPLSLSERRLETFLAGIREIEHVEIIRIGSRFPVLLPQRITDGLADMLARYHPIFFNTHFNHPKEITSEAAAACDRLMRNGIPVQNQSVLLRGVNDDLATMLELVRGLLKIRLRPYYLYHCDSVTGVSHFATTIAKGRNIMSGLVGHTSGLAVPQYVLTTPLGKIPLSEDAVEAVADGLALRSYNGQTIVVDARGATVTGPAEPADGAPDLTGATWFKSSLSKDSSQCVEVAFVGDRVGVRDSKNPDRPALVFTQAEWAAFVGGVHGGEFDR